ASAQLAAGPDAGAAFEMTADEPGASGASDAQFNATYDAGAAFDSEPSDFAANTVPAAPQLADSVNPTLDFSDDAIRDAAVGDDTATQVSLFVAAVSPDR
nr:hypothetical protein [Kofleriaceae bacterium]